MLKELLQKDNYNILNFSLFVEYIEQQDILNPILISDNNDKNNRKIIFSQNGYEKCVLTILKDQEKEWLSLNKFLKASDTATKSVEEMVFLKYYNNQYYEETEENIFIRHNLLTINNNIATVKFSSFSYKNEELKKIINSSRTVKYTDIKIYRDDWLANIICHIDAHNIPVIEKIEQEINNSKNKVMKNVI